MRTDAVLMPSKQDLKIDITNLQCKANAKESARYRAGDFKPLSFAEAQRGFSYGEIPLKK